MNFPASMRRLPVSHSDPAPVTVIELLPDFRLVLFERIFPPLDTVTVPVPPFGPSMMVPFDIHAAPALLTVAVVTLSTPLPSCAEFVVSVPPAVIASELLEPPKMIPATAAPGVLMVGPGI
ncbi:hypothetical protein [Kaistia terrae]|uniref:Uncharacterized protein n=1 Tax=Kaistia terrae TaxID=537017 RepID=A0ABW0PW53_9HYPH